MKLSVNQFYNYQQNYECGGCSASLKVILHDTLGLLCSKCGTFHGIQRSVLYDNQYKVLTLSKRKYVATYQPTIPVGTSLKLKGESYLVTGVLDKMEANFHWQEYYLYNKEKGYRFLSEYQGHWIWLRELAKKEIPRVEKYQSHAYFEGDTFNLYQKYEAEIYDAIGEFPIDLAQVTTYSVREYINPPLMITVEYKEDFKEGDWFLGEHLAVDELQESLEGSVTLPVQEGVGVLQPLPYSMPFIEVMKISLLGVLAAILLFLLIPHSKEVVYERSFGFADSLFTYQVKDNVSIAKPYISTSFELTKGNKNLELHLRAPLDNEWLELETILVNETTGEEFTVPLGIEYYSGVEEGESWTEGEVETDEVLEKIPAGKYHLEITPISSTNRTSFDLRITRDLRQVGSLLWVVFLLLIYPLIQFCLERDFEKRRWSQSDYSPFDEAHFWGLTNNEI